MFRMSITSNWLTLGRAHPWRHPGALCPPLGGGTPSHPTSELASASAPTLHLSTVYKAQLCAEPTRIRPTCTCHFSTAASAGVREADQDGHPGHYTAEGKGRGEAGGQGRMILATFWPTLGASCVREVPLLLALAGWAGEERTGDLPHRVSIFCPTSMPQAVRSSSAAGTG